MSCIDIVGHILFLAENERPVVLDLINDPDMKNGIFIEVRYFISYHGTCHMCTCDIGYIIVSWKCHAMSCPVVLCDHAISYIRVIGNIIYHLSNL